MEQALGNEEESNALSKEHLSIMGLHGRSGDVHVVDRAISRCSRAILPCRSVVGVPELENLEGDR